MQVRAICILGVLCVASSAYAQEFQCDITQKYICEVDGCKPYAPTLRNRIDLKKGTYIRCDGDYCTNYEARITRSGVFIVIEVPGQSAMARIADNIAEAAGFNPMSFHEVIVQFQTVFLSYGSCKPM